MAGIGIEFFLPALAVNGAIAATQKVYGWRPDSSGQPTSTPQTFYTDPACVTPAGTSATFGANVRVVYQKPDLGIVFVVKSADDATTYATVFRPARPDASGELTVDDLTDLGANWSDALQGNYPLPSGAIYSQSQVDALLDLKQSLSAKAQANGYASLGGDGKVPAAQLPVSGSYLGSWNATTNSPTITSSVGTNGEYYIVSVAGSTTINGTSSWAVGDQIRFNGSVWQKIPSTAGVTSVASKTGAVTLVNADISDSTTVGRNVMGAASKAAAATAIGVGTGDTVNFDRINIKSDGTAYLDDDLGGVGEIGINFEPNAFFGYQPSANKARFVTDSSEEIAYGGGVSLGAATGGRQGLGTINVVNGYINGVALSDLFQSKDTDLGVWATLTPSANFQTLVPQSFGQMRSSLGLVIGTNVEAWSAELDALAALSSTGIAVRTGAGAWAQRTLTVGTGLTITNPGGVAGNIDIALDSDLASWAAITRASGFDTLVTTPSSANLRAFINDETGTGVLVFNNTPTLIAPQIDSSNLFTAQGGSEGGQINLEKAPSGSTLNGNVALDTQGDVGRLFENGGTSRGVRFPFKNMAAGAGSVIGLGIQIFASIAAMQSSTVAAADSPLIIQTVLDHNAGDGGGGFRYDPSDTTSTDNNGTVIVTASGLRFKRQLDQDELNIQFFGAALNGSTDDSAAIQATIDAGLAIYHPAGTARIASGVTVYNKSQFSYRGDGSGLSQFLVDFGTGDAVTIGDGVGLESYITFRGIRFYSNSNRTSGATLSLNLLYLVSVQDVTMAAQCDGFVLNTIISVTMNNCAFVDGTPGSARAVVVDGGNDTFLSLYAKQDGGSEGLYGLDLKFTAAAWVTDSDFIGYQRGVNVNPRVSGAYADWCFFAQVAADGCTEAGWYFDLSGAADANSRIKGFQTARCWAGSCRRGVHIKRTNTSAGVVDGIELNGFTAVYNDEEGIYIEGTSVQAVQLVGAIVAGNGVSPVVAISKAASAVVTTYAAHSLSVNDVVKFTGIYGMTQLEALSGTITAVTTTTFTVNINSTGFSTYTGGGRIQRTSSGTNNLYRVAGNSNVYDGVRVAGGVLRLMAVACVIGDWGDFGATQRYAITLESGATDHIMIAANQLQGNATGEINDLATGTNKYIQTASYIRLNAGSAAAPAYSFHGDSNTGLYSVSADVLGLAAGGALQASVDTSGINLASGKTYRLNGTSILSSQTHTSPTLNNASIDATNLFARAGGSEGGQINMQLGSSGVTLAAGIAIDLSGDQLRFFENGGTVRGLKIDMTQLAASVGSYLPHSPGTTGGTGSAGAGKQYVNLVINGTTYKLLHDN